MAMGEFEPYSFESMRNSSSSEDEASDGEEPARRGPLYKLGRATRKEMFMLPGDR